MDIKITCRACDRTYPLAMTVDPEGRQGYCPFCGEVLAFQYVSTYVDTAERVMAIAPELLRQLTLLAELAGNFKLDTDSIAIPIIESINVQDAKVAEPYRPGWPPAKAEPVK